MFQGQLVAVSHKQYEEPLCTAQRMMISLSQSNEGGRLSGVSLGLVVLDCRANRRLMG